MVDSKGDNVLNDKAKDLNKTAEVFSKERYLSQIFKERIKLHMYLCVGSIYFGKNSSIP